MVFRTTLKDVGPVFLQTQTTPLRNSTAATTMTNQVTAADCNNHNRRLEKILLRYDSVVGCKPKAAFPKISFQFLVFAKSSRRKLLRSSLPIPHLIPDTTLSTRASKNPGYPDTSAIPAVCSYEHADKPTW